MPSHIDEGMSDIERTHPANSENTTITKADQRKNLTNGDILDLFSNPRFSSFMRQYYWTIFFWHSAVLAAAVLASLLTSHFVIAIAWERYRAPRSLGDLALFTIITFYGASMQLRNPDKGGIMSSSVEWLKSKGWILSRAKASDITSVTQYGSIISSASTATETSVAEGVRGSGSTSSESETLTLHSVLTTSQTAKQTTTMGHIPPQFTSAFVLLQVSCAILPLTYQVYYMVTSDDGPDGPKESALWKAEVVVSYCVVLILLTVHLMVVQRIKRRIQKLVEQAEGLN